MESFIAYAVFHGLFSGSLISLRGVVLQDIMGRENLANIFGLFNFWTAPGLFGIPFLSGALADRFSYAAPFVFTGALFIVAALLLAVSALLHRREKQMDIDKS